MSTNEIVNLRVIEDAVSEMNQELTFWINTYKKDKGKLEKQLKNVIEQVTCLLFDRIIPREIFIEIRERWSRLIKISLAPKIDLCNPEYQDSHEDFFQNRFQYSENNSDNSEKGQNWPRGEI